MRVFLLLCLLLVACAGLAPRQSAEDRAHPATVLLELTNGGSCSGTILEPGNVILTAAHCNPGERLVAVNHVPVNVESVQVTGGDQAWVVIDHTFPAFAVLGGPLKQGDAVFIFGNPGGEFDLLRRGYVVGTARSGSWYLDLRGSHGDSGAGVFNARGELVGVISAGDFFTMMILVVIWPLDPPEPAA